MEKEIKFPFKCPVCGKDEFENYDYLLDNENSTGTYIKYKDSDKWIEADGIQAYDVHCWYCGWEYDLKQLDNYDIVGDRNKKTVNEMKKEYQEKIKENPNYVFETEPQILIPHPCPVCGETMFKCELSYEICPVCGWQDDGSDEDDDEDSLNANSMTFSQAKEHFKKMREIDPHYRWFKKKTKKKMKLLKAK